MRDSRNLSELKLVDRGILVVHAAGWRRGVRAPLVGVGIYADSSGFGDGGDNLSLAGRAGGRFLPPGKEGRRGERERRRRKAKTILYVHCTETCAKGQGFKVQAATSQSQKS